MCKTRGGEGRKEGKKRGEGVVCVAIVIVIVIVCYIGLFDAESGIAVV